MVSREETPSIPKAYQKSIVRPGLHTFDEKAAYDIENGVSGNNEDVVETVHAEKEQKGNDIVLVYDCIYVVAHYFDYFFLLLFEDNAQGHENDNENDADGKDDAVFSGNSHFL